MTDRSTNRKGGGLWAAALAVGLVLTGCAEDAPEVTMRLDIRDGVLRDAGADCGGGGSFRYLHPTAEYQIVSPAGEVVSSGELPQGTAEKNFAVDFGELSEPTACRMEFPVRGLSSLDGHSLRVEGHPDILIIEHPDNPPTAVVP
jgi:hypothetical protein